MDEVNVNTSGKMSKADNRYAENGRRTNGKVRRRNRKQTEKVDRVLLIGRESRWKDGKRNKGNNLFELRKMKKKTTAGHSLKETDINRQEKGNMKQR